MAVDKSATGPIEFLFDYSAQVDLPCVRAFQVEGVFMKFTKPISREVDIDGNTYVVTLDETGVDFRVKGKRKSSRVEWARVLEIAGPEQSAAGDQNKAETSQPGNVTPAPVAEDQYDTQPLQERNLNEEAGENQDDAGERTRSAGAGESGPEA